MLGIGEVPELGGDRDAKAETGGRGERRLLWCVARRSVFVCDLCVCWGGWEVSLLGAEASGGGGLRGLAAG